MKKNKKIFYSSEGFSLIELMIVVGILAILGSIAVPIYRNYISSSKEASAKATLDQFPILLESFRAENGRFPISGTFNYIEAANGTVTTDTIRTGTGLIVGGSAGLKDFKPRSATQEAGKGILFNYQLIISNSGTNTESATFTATGVRDGTGITANGSYN